MVDTGGAQRHPASTEALLRYWAEGPGAALIGWGKPGGGDFERCIVEIQKAITKDGKPPLGDRVIRGLCNHLHTRATGFPPGKAPSERKP